MTYLLNPVTGKYMLNPAPEFLHQEVVSWLSELSFLETEIEFLKKLLKTAFLRTTSKNQMNELKALENSMEALTSKNFIRVKKNLISHEHDLSMLDLDLFKTKKRTIEDTHHDLYRELEALKENIKAVKLKVFALVEKQLKLGKNIKAGFEEGTIAL